MQQDSKQDHIHYPTDLRIPIHEITGIKEISPFFIKYLIYNMLHVTWI
jgi:hypothetical protein